MKYLVTIFFSLILICKPAAYGQFTPAPVVVSQETTVINGITFLVHKVEQNQTVFSICKAYGIESEVIMEDNPDLRNGLKTGMSLYIRKNLPVQEDYIYHTVRWYENLSVIAKKYNVTEESIIKLNSLDNSLLKTRQLLKIAKKESGILSEEQKATVQHELPVTVEIKHNSDGINEEPSVGKEIKRGLSPFRQPSSQVYNVALILPIGSNNIESHDGNNNYLDFYQGFLIALEDLKQEGMSLNLKVFDLPDYTNGTLLAQTGKLDGSEIIIGPILMNDVEPVLRYASERDIPLVSPMDPKTETLITGNPKFFQVSSNVYSQQTDLLGGLSPASHVTLIYESSSPDAELVNMTKEILTERGIKFSTIYYNVLSGRSISPQIASKLTKSGMNDVVVVSNSEAFVSDVLRNLNLLNTRNNYQITLYGTPRWRNFENVDINYYHSMNLHLSLQYYIDYTQESVRRFLARYRALYGTEPTPYSFQAYDVAYYFLGALYHLGPDFTENIERYSRELLQTDLGFVRQSTDNGFINSTTRQIIYKPDYSIEISRPDL